jgi:hypothetical protein
VILANHFQSGAYNVKRLGIALFVAGTAACSFLNSTVSGASDQAGHNLGASMVGNSGASQGGQSASAAGGAGGSGSMSAATMNPAFMNVYMTTIMTFAFSPGGYDISQAAYKPGEYTRWTGHGDSGKSIQLERAHLFDDAQGRSWWKVKWTEENGKTTIVEGLLDNQQQRFVRMRARFPDDAEGSELPVDQNNYYHPPQKLSPESVEGASRGVESVSVPAGTFSAKHIVFGGVDGSHEWWVAAHVPGGTVKQLMKGRGNDTARFQMELAAYGKDSASELGSK